MRKDCKVTTYGGREARRHRGGLVIALLLVLSSLGCGREERQPPNREEVLKAFSLCTRDADSGSTQVPPVQIVIDDSESMRGYVAAPNSVYRRLVRKLLEKSVASGYIVQIGGFANLQQEGEVSLETLLSRNFYVRGDTPLAALFTDIASAKEQKIYVVISDMVQSETGRDSLALTGAFRRMVGAAPAIALYAFRSAFRGQYFIETEPKAQVTLDVPDDGGKPFYVLIIAPSNTALRRFELYAGIGPLTSGTEYGTQFQTFYPGDRPIDVGRVNFVAPSAPLKSSWNGDDVEQPCKGRASVQVNPFERGKARSGRQELVFSFAAVARQPVILPERYGVEVDKLDLKLKTMSVSQARAATIAVKGLKLGQPSFTVTYGLPAPDRGQYEIYRVRFRAGAGNLGLPPWLGDWSTADDRDDPRRTLNLATIVEAMVRSSTENVVFFDHVIQLDGGE